MHEDQQRWDDFFMDIAKRAAQETDDRSRGVGCVITNCHHDIVSYGFNAFPPGVYVNAPEAWRSGAEQIGQLEASIERRHDKPAKYFYTEHAERRAIYSAARQGHATQNGIIYIPWFPCADCARAIIAAGMVEVVCTPPDLSDAKWGKDFEAALNMLNEARCIRIRFYEKQEKAA